jgi:3-hydroxyacyl-CoA dehydrogenase
MPYAINRVAVIGAGTMGAAIAGHIANAGLPVTLLDLAPAELTPEEAAAGLAPDSPPVRNRIVRAGYERMLKAKPDNLFAPSVAARIRLGNLTDGFEEAVTAADWIIEAIVERPGPKQALMARIETCAKPGAIITTNTSGIPVSLIMAGRSPSFRQRALGAHFFNPPRYLRLLELIPTGDTDPAITARLRAFAEHILGKGVVVCNDTPTFIANRLFSIIQGDLVEFAAAHGYTVEETDLLTGPLLGRPKTATFRLLDIVGIDVMALIAQNLYPLIPHDEGRTALHGERTRAILHTLIDNGLLGAKSGQGFYRTVVDDQGGKSFWGLDLEAAAKGVVRHLPPNPLDWPHIAAAAKLPLPQRLAALIANEDRAGRLVWHTLAHTLAYASRRIPEIADSITEIDNAMRWGFAWELGPFETWDALGLHPTLARMESEGFSVAPWVHGLVEAGRMSFYQASGPERRVYSLAQDDYRPVEGDGQAASISALYALDRTLAANESAALLDMGGGILLLEFRSKMNTLDAGIMALAQAAVERLHGGAAGLVIGNQGALFSAGANLKLFAAAVEAGQWRELEAFLRLGQDTLMALRRAPAPVTAAPFRRVLGGGVEACLAADRIVAHAESYLGLVEASIGIIPAWGGCKEMVRRNVSPHMRIAHVGPMPYLRRVFETIGFARVSTSALDAQEIGYLGAQDRIVMNDDRLLSEAKRETLHLASSGYIPPQTTGTVYAAGRGALANMRVEIHALRRASRISAHDAKIADKLAYTLCGGDLSEPSWMDEQYFLDLEREAFLSLAGEPRTQERIRYMLQHGKPLRN